MSLTRNPFQSILVPVDGSPVAEQAVSVSLSLARRTGAKLRLVLVHRELSPLLIMEPAEVYTKTLLAFEKSESEYLRALADRVTEELGRPVASAALKGPVTTTLAEYITDIGADLVVMTTHGRGGIQRAWLGSVTDHLIRTLKVPVLVVRAREEPAPAGLETGDILVPLDGSPLAETVLEPVVGLAKALNAQVELVQVVHPVMLATDPALPVPTGYDEELTAREREAAVDYLRDIAEQVRSQGVEASGTAVLGYGTASTILDLASSKRVALVALATHGRGGIRRLALGSVADKLVRGSDVPVLVVRPVTQRRIRRSVSKDAMTETGSTDTHPNGAAKAYVLY